ncbi:MAG: M50 family metallopeptidase [Saprospiraceae bacterium]|nr:M50 family metallopeptidase [Saprospiraceae bacterium]
MKYLLLVRVLTITAIFLFINKWNGELTAPLSIFTSVIHELGHATGAVVSNGQVEGFTLAPDCPCIYACTRNGNAWITLIGGHLFSIGAAFLFVYLGRILSKIPEYIFGTYLILGLLMFLTVRLLGDDRILSIWMVIIYFLLFLFFILSQTTWAGAFLVFFGFFNLGFMLKDTLTGGVLADVSRYVRLLPDIVPAIVVISLWLGAIAYIAIVLLSQVAATNVDWNEGKRFLKNLDLDKILLFLSILPNLIGFAIDQLLEFLLIEFKGIFDGIRRFLSI